MGGGWKVAGAALMLAAGAVEMLEAQEIYTCTDGSGRRLTADRPIPECLAREQLELDASGAVRRRIGPAMSPAEEALAEQKAQLAQEEQRRAAEARRRDQALRARFPDEATHQAARRAALAKLDAELAASEEALGSLDSRRKALDAQVRAAGNDAQRAAVLRRQSEDLLQQQAAVQRTHSGHTAERRRLVERYDDERVRLGRLWNEGAAPAPAAAATDTTATRTTGRAGR